MNLKCAEDFVSDDRTESVFFEKRCERYMVRDGAIQCSAV
jgi:hypothetical protein